MPDLAELITERDAVAADKAAKMDEYLVLGSQQRALDDQIAVLEQGLRDDEVEADLRGRADLRSAQVAALTISATMPDETRAARFTALAEEFGAAATAAEAAAAGG